MTFTPGTKTNVFATDGTEICLGDRVEIYAPSRGTYSDLLLARGEVYFEHGSFRVRKEAAHVNDCPRLDDFAHDCTITIIPRALGRTRGAEREVPEGRTRAGIQQLNKARNTGNGSIKINPKVPWKQVADS